MASEYLPTASANRYYGADGRLYGTDMNEYFIGDPFTEGGIICGTGAIVTAADGYLADTGSALRAYDITGSSPEELYRRVRNGQPVVVWVTISMADRRAAQGWYTENGDYVDWSKVRGAGVRYPLTRKNAYVRLHSARRVSRGGIG